MSDPLSIAASVAGLITLSGALYTAIKEFVEKASNVPQSAYELLLSVVDMRLALKSVSELIDSYLEIPLQRRAMVQVDHLIICLTQSILTFSNLEKFVNTWPERLQHSRWQRLRFSVHEKELTQLNARIQQHKTSISLVLNILQCKSDMEARKSRESLDLVMKNAIKANEDRGNKSDDRRSIVLDQASSSIRGLADAGPSNGGLGSIITISEEGEDNEHRTSTIRETTEQHNDTDIERPRQFVTPAFTGSFYSTLPMLFDTYSIEPAGPSHLDKMIKTRSFERILARTSVYARIRGNDWDISNTTSLLKSAAWSRLSGLSLAEVSNLSVAALPISLADIENSSWYREHIVTQSPTKVHKILVFGESGVGKSALMNKFCYGHIDGTLGIQTSHDSHSREILVDNLPSVISITDTSGLDEYEVLSSNAIDEAEGFMITYSITDFYSFCRVRSLFDRIIEAKSRKGHVWTSNIPVVIVATKADLTEERSVPEDYGPSLATDLACKHCECSATTGDSTQLPFMEIIKILRNTRESMDEDETPTSSGLNDTGE